MTAVKRKSYESPLRVAQARATRRAIVDAAAKLFIQQGYGATTVDAIAAAAGVSRKTVFTAVGGKTECIKLALDWAIVGDDEQVPLMDREEIQAQRREPDARKILRMYAAMNVDIAERVALLLGVVESVAGAEPELRALAGTLAAQRRFGMGHLAAELDTRGALRSELDVDQAADILWLMSDPAQYRALVVTRGWSSDRYQEWLGDTLATLLVPPRYTAPKKRTAARGRHADA
jgi:AcrR family transcriptional regulator